MRRVFSFGFEAWKQPCRGFEPWVSSRFQWMLQAPLPSTRTDSPVRETQQQTGNRSSENVEVAVLQKCLRDGELTHRPDLQPGSPTTKCNLACDETTDLTKAGQTRVVLWNARTCLHVARAKAAKRARTEAKVSRQRNRRNASLVYVQSLQE